MDNDSPTLLRLPVKEAARRLGISPDTIYKAVAHGIGPYAERLKGRTQRDNRNRLWVMLADEELQGWSVAPPDPTPLPRNPPTPPAPDARDALIEELRARLADKETELRARLAERDEIVAALRDDLARERAERAGEREQDRAERSRLLGLLEEMQRSRGGFWDWFRRR